MRSLLRRKGFFASFLARFPVPRIAASWLAQTPPGKVPTTSPRKSPLDGASGLHATAGTSGIGRTRQLVPREKRRRRLRRCRSCRLAAIKPQLARRRFARPRNGNAARRRPPIPRTWKARAGRGQPDHPPDADKVAESSLSPGSSTLALNRDPLCCSRQPWSARQNNGCNDCQDSWPYSLVNTCAVGFGQLTRSRKTAWGAILNCPRSGGPEAQRLTIGVHPGADPLALAQRPGLGDRHGWPRRCFSTCA